MKFVYVETPADTGVTWSGSMKPRDPTDEEREAIQRMAEEYDESEHARLSRAALPSPRDVT